MQNILKKPNLPYLALITGVLCIGLSPILIKLAHAPGIVTSFYRFIFGSITLSVIFCFYQRKHKQKISRKGVLFSLIAGFCLATDMALWTTGIVASNATLPTLAGNLAPLWVGIGAVFIFKEKQNYGFWIGLFIAIFGVGLLLFKDFMQPTQVFRGIMLGLAAGLFYAGYLLSTQPGREQLNTLSFLFLSTIFTTFFALIYMLIFGYSFTGYDTYTWTLWIIMGLGMQVGAWFLINYSQGFLPASIVSPTLLAQPVVTAVVAILFLGERLTGWHLGGGIIIIAGIYLVHFSKRKYSK